MIPSPTTALAALLAALSCLVVRGLITAASMLIGMAGRVAA